MDKADLKKLSKVSIILNQLANKIDAQVDSDSYNGGLGDIQSAINRACSAVTDVEQLVK